MSYNAAIDYLYSLQKFGIKLGLDKTEAILSLADNPHKKMKCIHVAGTNGKGSVSAMIASVLKAHGFRVGLFTSPHLVSFTERIRVNDRDISEAEVSELTTEIRSAIENADRDLNPTFFEVVTAIAFVYFVRQKVEWAVIETGMGGRLDATNLVLPEVSVITNISCDHREFLGDSLAVIAGEKAGIIKRGVPVVSAGQQKDAEDVIASAACDRSAPLVVYGRDFSGCLKSTGIEGTYFDYSNGTVNLDRLFTPLAGEYQVVNASLAVKAVSIAIGKNDFNNDVGADLCACPQLSVEAVRKGLASTRWRGRLELVSSDPPVIVDGAHNAEAAGALAGFVTGYLPDRKIIMVLGIMADKDIKEILDALLPVAAETIFTSPAYSRAESPDRLADLARAEGFANIRVAATLRDALGAAKELQSSLSGAKPAVIIITGSFYTAGEALEALGERSVLSTLRETL
ncbi:MAG TPA: folylpolyglutamate synthase/dihydrofolate synthase family protein [Dissulfurispiraceae bacterium]|nr:folylpolyglutamate synthase/dihydrofolate synthase family protein [Dissulfurispiraceae bacterium]